MARDSPWRTEKLTSSRMLSQPSASLTRLPRFLTSIATMPISNFLWMNRAASVALSALALALIPHGASAQAVIPAQAATKAPTATGGASQGVALPQSAAPQILVLGDSLSAEYGLKRGSGWVALLQQDLEKGTARSKAGKPVKYQIQNASISGETTAGGKTRLADLLKKHQPAITIIELGANDALRGLDLGMTENNLREMVRLARQAGSKVLLVGMQIPPNFGQAYAERFKAGFAKVAQSEKVELVPFFMEGVADKLELFQSDRIHPTEAAQAQLKRNVEAGLLRIW